MGVGSLGLGFSGKPHIIADGSYWLDDNEAGFISVAEYHERVPAYEVDCGGNTGQWKGECEALELAGQALRRIQIH